MKLPRDEFEAKFRVYRDHLQREIGRLRDAASVLRQINELQPEYAEELNVATSFFRTVEDALFTTIILWADKLIDEKGERGLFNFLTFVEYNRNWMTVKELQRRNSYPDDHYMLRPENRGAPITARTIEEDRQRIRNLSALTSIKLRRDKFQGHFDMDYFFDREKLQREAPITWEELKQAGEVMTTTINNYSSDFDGNLHAGVALNIDDLSRLLDAVREGRKR